MKKVKLFTHTDLDGVGCAILAILGFGKDNVSVEYCNYNEINEKVLNFLVSDESIQFTDYFITDISVNEEVAKELDLIKIRNIKLFDHHKTAEWLE